MPIKMIPPAGSRANGIFFPTMMPAVSPHTVSSEDRMAMMAEGHSTESHVVILMKAMDTPMAMASMLVATDKVRMLV